MGNGDAVTGSNDIKYQGVYSDNSANIEVTEPGYPSSQLQQMPPELKALTKGRSWHDYGASIKDSVNNKGNLIRKNAGLLIPRVSEDTKAMAREIAGATWEYMKKPKVACGLGAQLVGAVAVTVASTPEPGPQEILGGIAK